MRGGHCRQNIVLFALQHSGVFAFVPSFGLETVSTDNRSFNDHINVGYSTFTFTMCCKMEYIRNAGKSKALCRRVRDAFISSTSNQIGGSTWFWTSNLQVLHEYHFWADEREIHGKCQYWMWCLTANRHPAEVTWMQIRQREDLRYWAHWIYYHLLYD